MNFRTVLHKTQQMIKGWEMAGVREADFFHFYDLLLGQL
jgi:hypothetical protein